MNCTVATQPLVGARQVFPQKETDAPPAVAQDSRRGSVAGAVLLLKRMREVRTPDPARMRPADGLFECGLMVDDNII